MSETITIYGHEIELENSNSHITDVIILAREIIYNDDGTLAGAILMSATPTSTYIMQRGIIETARDQMRDTE